MVILVILSLTEFPQGNKSAQQILDTGNFPNTNALIIDLKQSKVEGKMVQTIFKLFFENK
jgi:hypothetical protein